MSKNDSIQRDRAASLEILAPSGRRGGFPASQSTGCPATTAISYGVLADVAMPAKRGRMLGTAMIAANTGVTLGPLLGGTITD